MYVEYLRTLNSLIFTKGSDEDYLRKKEELARRFHCEPTVADILWGLMNESMVETCEDEFERKDLRGVMADFKRFVKKATGKKD